MADTQNPQQPQANDAPKEKKKSLRWHRRQERLKRVNEGKRAKPVRVYPRDEIIARDIRHGVSRRGFPEGGGSVEWPLDQFTKRRIKDGTVRLENEQESKARTEQRSKDRQRHTGSQNTPTPAS